VLSGPSSRCPRPARRRREWNSYGTQPSETPKSRPRKLGNRFRALTPSGARTAPRAARPRHAADLANSQSGAFRRPQRGSGLVLRSRTTTPSYIGTGNPPQKGIGSRRQRDRAGGGRGPARARAETEVARRDLDLSAGSRLRSMHLGGGSPRERIPILIPRRMEMCGRQHTGWTKSACSPRRYDVLDSGGRAATTS
jgi:hypothetical protein